MEARRKTLPTNQKVSAEQKRNVFFQELEALPRHLQPERQQAQPPPQDLVPPLHYHHTSQRVCLENTAPSYFPGPHRRRARAPQASEETMMQVSAYYFYYVNQDDTADP